jgi:hypothetical protein
VEGHSVRGDQSTPSTVRAGGALIGLQGLGGLVFAVFVLVQPGVLRAADRYGEAGFLALLAAAVIGLGVALVLGKRGARSPAVVVQLVLVGISGYAAVPSSRPELGIPFAALCVLVLYLLLNPRARDWVMDLEEASDKDPD